MNGYRAAFLGTAFALTVSLAFHVAAGLEPSTTEGPDDAAAAATDGAVLGETAATAPAAEDPRLARLRAQLAACRETSWQVVAKAIQKDAQRQAKRRAAQAGAEKVTAADSSFERQQAARCAIALQFARLMLERDRDAFAASLHGVGTEAWIEDEVRSRVAALEEQFSPGQDDLKQLQQGYETLWTGYGRELHRLIEHEDWVGLVDASKTFWRDEDKLVADLLGPEARAEYRASALETRSAVIATLATLAGLPWDDKLAW
jgi:hypothetical protein